MSSEPNSSLLSFEFSQDNSDESKANLNLWWEGEKTTSDLSQGDGINLSWFVLTKNVSY